MEHNGAKIFPIKRVVISRLITIPDRLPSYSKRSSNVEILVKNQNFGKKIKFLVKIKILVKKIKFWLKIKIFVKKIKFGSKIKFWSKIKLRSRNVVEIVVKSRKFLKKPKKTYQLPNIWQTSTWELTVNFG